MEGNLIWSQEHRAGSNPVALTKFVLESSSPVAYGFNRL